MTDTASQGGSVAPAERPSALFWLGLGLVYVAFLVLGLGFPILGKASGRLNLLLNMLGYALSLLSMIGASFFLALMISRVRLPYVWWLLRVRGVDVSEYDGVYFVGGSVDRVSEGARRKVFSADDSLSRWDILFGVMNLALLAVHGSLAIASYRILRSVYFPS